MGSKGYENPCGCLIPKGHKRQSLHKINLKKELCNGLNLVVGGARGIFSRD